MPYHRRHPQAEPAGGDACVLARPVKLRSGLGGPPFCEDEAAAVDIDADWESCSQSARAALDTVPRQAIDEMKRMKQPPAAVKLTFDAALVALGYQEPGWKDSVKFLSSAASVGISGKLTEFNPRAMTPAMLRRMKPFVATFSVEQVRRSSLAASCVAAWVHAVYDFGLAQEKNMSNYAFFRNALRCDPLHGYKGYKSVFAS